MRMRPGVSLREDTRWLYFGLPFNITFPVFEVRSQRKQKNQASMRCALSKGYVYGSSMRCALNNGYVYGSSMRCALSNGYVYGSTLA